MYVFYDILYLVYIKTIGIDSLKLITHKTNTVVCENSMCRDLYSSDYPYKPVTG